MIDNKLHETYQKELNKKLLSFKKRSPIYFEFVVTPVELVLNLIRFNKVEYIKIDYKKDTREFISEVRDFLRFNYYPKLKKYEEEVVEPSTLELSAYMDKNKASFDEAFKKLSRVKKEIIYIIDKISFKKNEIIVLNGNRQFVYETKKMPLAILLNKFIKNTSTEEEAFKIFNKNTVFKFEVINEKERMDNK